MEKDYVLLTEKEEMWARMLMEVLSDNDVPCVARSVLGAGFTLRTGMHERLEIYVPSEKLNIANEFLNELFSE